jgi:putative FmdB family regulatory protein
MPIYEYECAGCGKHFEIFQKMSAKPLTECRVCGGTLTKLISNCAFHLKGTGWYVTDYKKPVDSVGKKPPSSNGSKESSSVEAKSEPAPTTPKETKTETKSTESTGG